MSPRPACRYGDADELLKIGFGIPAEPQKTYSRDPDAVNTHGLQ
jgi:hypothetical protein